MDNKDNILELPREERIKEYARILLDHHERVEYETLENGIHVARLRREYLQKLKEQNLDSSSD